MQQKFLIRQIRVMLKIKQNIFEIAETKLAEQGLTKQALRSIEVALSLPAHYCDLIFPRGIDELIKSYNDWHDTKIISNLKIISNESIRAKISRALIAKTTSQNQLFVFNSLKYYKTPTNIPFAGKIGWQTACAIWQWAGDSSLDHNFYSKRLIFEVLYYKALNFYCSDTSVDHIQTENYIESLVNDFVNSITKLKQFSLSKLPIFRYFL